MRRVLLAAAAFLSLAISGQASLAADDAPEAPYVDDRSSAEAVIRSLYSAINRHEFARAWGYYGDAKPAKDFDSFVKGYDGTDKVEVTTGAISDDGAAGSIFYNVPVAIRATDKSGGEKVFAGCYTLRQVNAQIQAAPPFDPIHIEKGALKPSTADFEAALPPSCGDGPPPPKKDTALEKAKKAFLATYSDQCDKQFLGNEPEVFSIKYKDKDAQPGDPDKETRLFHFSCSAAAYNESSVYYMPARTTVPPALSIAAGTTSAKSLIAEAPKITTRSLSRASEAAASATGAISCGVRRSAVNLPPERASRASVTRSVLSSTLGLMPGRTVWMTPTRTG